MMSLDVADSGRVYTAFLVYLDLLEEFQLVCLRGREREAEDLQVMVPTPVHATFSHEKMRQIMKRTHTASDAPASITLVYYKLTDGFVMPDPPDDTEDVDHKQWRKKRKRHLR
ncbi:tRNA-splicing endonuclease subunit Sen15-like isoform X2 [Paroedura picta]